MAADLDRTGIGGNSRGSIALRDYVERMIAHERELRERAEEAAHQALELQAREYGRRLEALNHAHEQTQQILGHTISREMFDAYAANMSEWRDVISQQAAEQRGAAARQTYLIGLGVALLALGLRFLP